MASRAVHLLVQHIKIVLVVVAVVLVVVAVVVEVDAECSELQMCRTKIMT